MERSRIGAEKMTERGSSAATSVVRASGGGGLAGGGLARGRVTGAPGSLRTTAVIAGVVSDWPASAARATTLSVVTAKAVPRLRVSTSDGR